MSVADFYSDVRYVQTTLLTQDIRDPVTIRTDIPVDELY